MLAASSVYSFGLDDLAREAGGALKEVADKVEEVSDEVKAVNEIVNPSPTQETSADGNAPPTQNAPKLETTSHGGTGTRQGSESWLTQGQVGYAKLFNFMKENVNSFPIYPKLMKACKKFTGPSPSIEACRKATIKAMLHVVRALLQWEDRKESYQQFCVESASDNEIFTEMINFIDNNAWTKIIRINDNWVHVSNLDEAVTDFDYTGPLKDRFFGINGPYMTQVDVKLALKMTTAKAFLEGAENKTYSRLFSCPEDIDRLYKEGCVAVVPLCAKLRTSIADHYVAWYKGWVDYNLNDNLKVPQLMKKIANQKRICSLNQNQEKCKADGKQSSQAKKTK